MMHCTTNPITFFSNALTSSHALYSDYKNIDIRKRAVFIDYSWSTFRGTLAAQFILGSAHIIASCAKQLINYEVKTPLLALLNQVNYGKALISYLINNPLISWCHLISFNQFFVTSFVLIAVMHYGRAFYAQMIFAAGMSIVFTNFLNNYPIFKIILLGLYAIKIAIGYLYTESEKVTKNEIDTFIKSRPSKLQLISFGENLYRIKLYNSNQKLFFDYLTLSVLYLIKIDWFQYKTNKVSEYIFDRLVNEHISKFDIETKTQMMDLINGKPTERQFRNFIEKCHLKELQNNSQKALINYLIIATLYLRSQSTFFASWSNYFVNSKVDNGLYSNISAFTNQQN